MRNTLEAQEEIDLLEELITVIEAETSEYDPYTAGAYPESLKRADGSDMSETAARAVLTILIREKDESWANGAGTVTRLGFGQEWPVPENDENLGG